MTLEAVLLTGGKSTRMGSDKASLLIDGEPMVVRIPRLLREQGISTTILGPGGIPDSFPDGGPLLALFSYLPTLDHIFVCSCDLPGFNPLVPRFLESHLVGYDAALPVIDGKQQFLCGCYHRQAFFALHDAVASGARSMKLWLERLKVRLVTEGEFRLEGLDPASCLGANTPEEWNEQIRRHDAAGTERIDIRPFGAGS